MCSSGNSTANNKDPDETFHIEAVSTGFSLFSKPTIIVFVELRVNIVHFLNFPFHISGLTGLFKAQQGMFKVVSEDSSHKLAALSAAATQQPRLPATSSTLPSQALLGGLEEPLIAYKLEDYAKKFGQPPAETEAKKVNISIEGLLQAQTANIVKSPLGLPTNLGHPSLVQLSRHLPSVSMSSPSPIHQLLSNISRPTGTGITPVTASTLSSPTTIPTYLTGIKTVSGQSGNTAVAQVGQSEMASPSSSHSQNPISQSGSPLQNSVPTLMSSLTKSTGYNIGNVIKIVPSSSSPTDVGAQARMEEKRQVVQKLTFGDSPSISVTSQASVNLLSSHAPATQNIPASNEHTKDRVSEEHSSSAGETPNSTHSLSQIMSVSSMVSSSLQPVTSLPRTTTGYVSTSVPLALSSELPRTFTSQEAETLGNVSSLLGSSPVTERPAVSSSGIITQGAFSDAAEGFRPTPGRTLSIGSVSITVVTSSHRASASKTPTSLSTTYTATPKPSLSTLATTRTRRIRTPKQYDL